MKTLENEGKNFCPDHHPYCARCHYNVSYDSPLILTNKTHCTYITDALKWPVFKGYWRNTPRYMLGKLILVS